MNTHSICYNSCLFIHACLSERAHSMRCPEIPQLNPPPTNRISRYFVYCVTAKMCPHVCVRMCVNYTKMRKNNRNHTRIHAFMQHQTCAQSQKHAHGHVNMYIGSHWCMYPLEACLSPCRRECQTCMHNNCRGWKSDILLQNSWYLARYSTVIMAPTLIKWWEMSMSDVAVFAHVSEDHNNHTHMCVCMDADMNSYTAHCWYTLCAFHCLCACHCLRTYLHA